MLTTPPLTRAERRVLRTVARRRRFAAACAWLLVAICAIGSAYWADVRANSRLEAAARGDVAVISEPEERANSAVVFLNGFGTNDADSLARLQGPSIAEVLGGAETWSVRYGNALIDDELIARQLIELAEERDIHRLSFYGYSAGGVIALPVAERILDEGSVAVQSIWLDSTPDGDAGVRPAQLAARDWLLAVANAVPGSKYSTLFRYVGEMAFRMDRWTSGGLGERWEGFWKTSGDVVRALDDERLPGTWLLVDQVLAISNSRADEHIARIGELSEAGLRPVIVYLGTAQPGYDVQVDDVLSATNFCGYAQSAHLQCFSEQIPGAVHTRPDLSLDEYRAVVADAAPGIRRALADAELRRLLRGAQLEGAEPEPESAATPSDD